MATRGHRLYLLRHGPTEWSGSGRHTGRTEIPLTPSGQQRAREAADTLSRVRSTTAQPITFVSPRQRARHTAELAGLLPNTVDPNLAEWDYGDHEGLTTTQIRETTPQWTVWTHSCPNGESESDITTRAEQVLDRAREALEHRDVVLVGHGHFSRALVARWLDLPVHEGVRFALDPAAITVLGHERGVPQLQRANIPSTR